MDNQLAECFAASLLANNLETQKLRDAARATGQTDATTTIRMGMVLAERSMQLAMGYREAERQIQAQHEAQRLEAMRKEAEAAPVVSDVPAEAAVA